MEKTKDKSIKEKILSDIYFIAIIVAILIIVSFFIQINFGTGMSMYPTCTNRSLSVAKTVHKNTELKRYDVINTKRLPNNNNERIRKRIVGLPGETITIKGSKVYIDGDEFNDPAAFVNSRASGTVTEGKNVYLDDVKLNIGEKFYYKDIASIQEDENNVYLFTEKTWTLGDDEYFVMGDNRCMSNDSREFGPIKRNEITSINLVYVNIFYNHGGFNL